MYQEFLRKREDFRNFCQKQNTLREEMEARSKEKDALSLVHERAELNMHELPEPFWEKGD